MTCTAFTLSTCMLLIRSSRSYWNFLVLTVSPYTVTRGPSVVFHCPPCKLSAFSPFSHLLYGILISGFSLVFLPDSPFFRHRPTHSLLTLCLLASPRPSQLPLLLLSLLHTSFSSTLFRSTFGPSSLFPSTLPHFFSSHPPSPTTNFPTTFFSV